MSAQTFRHSAFARPASIRLLAVAILLIPLWLAIAWAVATP